MKASKILSLALALVMILALAIPLMSASAANDASITINKPANLSINGQTFDAYKIFDMEPLGGGVFKYTIADEFLDAADHLNPLIDKEDPNYGNVDMAALAKLLWEFIVDNDIQPTGSVTAADDVDGNDDVIVTESATIEDLPYGYYLVYGAGLSNGEPVFGISILTNAAPDATVDLKLDAPFIDKWVFNHNIDDWSKWTDVNMGDTVDFLLNSRVPAMPGYTSYTFIVHDTMSAGLTFDASTVKVMVGDIELNVDEDYEDFYEVKTSGIDAGETFNIVFDAEKFVTLNSMAGTPIVITYSAVLNKNAVIGAPGNPNTVNLEFSNNPYSTDGSTIRTPDDTVIVYTFDLIVYKYTGDLYKEEDAPLGDAKFIMRDANGKQLRFVKLSFPDKDDDDASDDDMAMYRLVTPEDETDEDVEIVDFIVSPYTGLIYIKGLDAGAYELEETEHPAGYNLLEGFVTAVIVHEDEEGAYHVEVNEAETNRVNIENKEGFSLPGTGGIGTTIFYLTALVLSTGLVALLIVRRRISVLQDK